MAAEKRTTLARTAVLVIDVQTALITGAHREQEILYNINSVIGYARDKNGLVVFVQHCHATYEALKKGNPGWAVHSSLDKRESDIFVEKEASDSFYQTDLDEVLHAHNIEHVVVTGLQTEFCVDTTCRSALSKGYAVTLISDAHTTGNSHLPAQDVIEHHNKILGNLAHPTQSIEVVPHSDWIAT